LTRHRISLVLALAAAGALGYFVLSQPPVAALDLAEFERQFDAAAEGVRVVALLSPT